MLPIMRAPIAVVILLIATFARANEEFVYWNSQIGGKDYAAMPSWGWIRDTPNWQPGQPLPITVDEAAAVAKKELEPYAPKSENWSLYYVDLMSFRSGTKDKWYFLFTFGSEWNAVTPRRARIPVNMSGVASSLYAYSPAHPKFVSLEQRFLEQADKILIPKIDLREATIEEALDDIRRKAVESDPKHIGIPIEMDERLLARELNLKSPPEDSPTARITVSLTDIPLAAALRYVAGLAECRMVPTRAGISILPGGSRSLLTESFPMAGASKSELARMRANPRQYFIHSGVEFGPGASCSFRDHGMTLVVTNAPEQMYLVHQALEKIPLAEKNKRSK